MKKYFEILKQSALFEEISEPELTELVACVQATATQYNAGNAIFLAGEKPEFVGIVLKGEASVVEEDFFGNRNILAHITQGELFGETFACAEVQALPVSVFAVSDCEILKLDFARILSDSNKACGFHHRLVYNMLKILAQKNLLLNRKARLLAKRTTREKLLSFLSEQAKEAGRSEFSIPFNRQALADFLSVDRSALSAELCRMRDDGLLEFHKNKFVLKESK